MSKQKDRHKKLPKICESCKINYIGRRNRRFCSMKCWHDFSKGANHANWKGGRSLSAVGYISIRLESGTRRLEHILIAEKVLGRSLKEGEVVHHVNGIKSDNRNKNLLICDKKYHTWLHQRMGQLYMKEHFGDRV